MSLWIHFRIHKLFISLSLMGNVSIELIQKERALTEFNELTCDLKILFAIY